MGEIVPMREQKQTKAKRVKTGQANSEYAYHEQACENCGRQYCPCTAGSPPWKRTLNLAPIPRPEEAG